MRSATFSQFGDPSLVLEIADRPIPQPGPGEIRIRMTMSSIHNHDLLTVGGRYGYKPELPAVAGSEATGIVDALGEGVTHLAVGQRVAASGTGAWSDYYLARAASVVPLPDAIDDNSAAQLISMPLSAVALLDFIGVEKGDWVIQNAANGAVGKALAMFARRRGVNVVNLVRREDAVKELAELGVSNVIATTQNDWQQAVSDITGGASIRAAVDGVGGTASGDLLSALGEGGQLISFGAMSSQPMQISASDMIFKQVVVKGFWLAKLAPLMPAEKMKSLIGEIVEGVAGGEVKLTVSDIFDLSDIAKAAAAAGQTGRTGKVLLRGQA